MKIYEEPRMEINQFSVEDIMKVSGGIGGDNETEIIPG